MEDHYDSYPGFVRDDLHGQLVEFRIAYADTTVSGIAALSVKSGRDGLLAVSVEIEENLTGRTVGKLIRQFHSTELIRFRLSRHENQDVAAFRLSSYIQPPSPATQDSSP